MSNPVGNNLSVRACICRRCSCVAQQRWPWRDGPRVPCLNRSC